MPNPRPLTRAKILRTALKLADQNGLHGVTMRRVAVRLGVGTMSLYHHVPSKEALHEGMADLVLAEVSSPPPEIDRWDDRISFMVRSVRQAVLRHPAIIPLLATRLPDSPVSLRLNEVALQALGSGRFTGEAAADAYRALASYTFGFLALEVGGFFSPGDGGDGRSSMPDLVLYPHLRGVAPHLFGTDPNLRFDRGLAAVLAGLERLRRKTNAVVSPDPSVEPLRSLDRHGRRRAVAAGKRRPNRGRTAPG